MSAAVYFVVGLFSVVFAIISFTGLNQSEEENSHRTEKRPKSVDG